MMKAISWVLLIGPMALAIGNTFEVTTDKQSILQNVGQIDLFSEIFAYLQAFMRQGIPALHVAPVDPYFLNRTLTIQQQFDPSYPDYKNINIDFNGVTFSGFSNFLYNAEMFLDPLSIFIFSINDDLKLQSYDMVTTAENIDGRTLQYRCGNVLADLFHNSFTLELKLRLNDTFLQVENFKIDYYSRSVDVNFDPADCTGDIELHDCTLELTVNALVEMTKDTMPAYFRNVSSEITTLLNDIFILRNVTDDGTFFTE